MRLHTLYPKKIKSPNIKIISSKKRSNITSRQSNDEVRKKYLRAKLCNLLQKNIVLNENKFNPRKFTESISNVHVKSFKNLVFKHKYLNNSFTLTYEDLFIKIEDKYYLLILVKSYLL